MPATGSVKVYKWLFYLWGNFQSGGVLFGPYKLTLYTEMVDEFIWINSGPDPANPPLCPFLMVASGYLARVLGHQSHWGSQSIPCGSWPRPEWDMCLPRMAVPLELRPGMRACGPRPTMPRFWKQDLPPEKQAMLCSLSWDLAWQSLSHWRQVLFFL